MKKLTLTLILLAGPGFAWAGHEPAPPSNLVSAFGARFWPYTGRDYSGSPTDPINLLFKGSADPRRIRQALLALDGDRTGYGELAAFTCTWKDAVGRPQTSYSRKEGWQGSAIQLECGDYAQVRSHLRLFRQGRYTLGGAHLEIQIPGTTSHEVLAWEIPEALVTIDLIRSGLVAGPPRQTHPITDFPYYRAIQQQVFNLFVPVDLRLALGLPVDDQASDVPLVNDGVATVLTLRGGPLEPIPPEAVVEFDHPFGAVSPKPFCSTGPLDWVRVTGSLHMRHRIRTDEHGRYASHFLATGTLVVVPINPSTQQPTGPPYPATVREEYRSLLTDRNQAATMTSVQTLFTNPVQVLFEQLWIGHKKGYILTEHCGF